MINHDRALELARDAGELHGIPREKDWQIVDRGELGWVCTPGIRRSNMGIAVTPRGKVATFPISAYGLEAALRLLATIPDSVVPPAPEEQDQPGLPAVVDGDMAVALVRAYVARVGLERPDEWTAIALGDFGWVCTSEGTRIVVARNGGVRLIGPAEDEWRVVKSLLVPSLPSLIAQIEAAAGATDPRV